MQGSYYYQMIPAANGMINIKLDIHIVLVSSHSPTTQCGLFKTEIQVDAEDIWIFSGF